MNTKTETTIIVGYDKRCWVTFKVKDATPAEIAMLSETDSTEALVMAAQLDREGRLEWGGESQDDSPEIFADYASPAVVAFDQDYAS